MKRNAALMLLIGAVALCLMGCGKDAQASNTGKGEATTSQAKEGEGKENQGDAGLGAMANAQEKTVYIQGVEKILKSMEEKMTAWQQQAGTAGEQGQEKMQTLPQQVQQQIADARTAVENMKAATGIQLKDARTAADAALQNAEKVFKSLQSYSR